MNEIVREPKWSRLATGPTKRRSTCEKDCARAEMEQEQSKRDCAREKKRNKEESKAKEKESDKLRKKRCIQGESSGDRYM